MQARYRERLIDEVKRCPVLYDTRHEHHRDIDVRDRCWADIADRLGANSEVLKREWKCLRDSLRQSLKKSNKGVTTKAGAPCRKWRFHSRMAFVLPYMTKRDRAVRFVKNDTKLNSETEQPSSEPEEETGLVEPTGAEADSLELFFASVCMAARRLPPARRAALQRQVLDALIRAEEDSSGCPQDSKQMFDS